MNPATVDDFERVNCSHILGTSASSTTSQTSFGNVKTTLNLCSFDNIGPGFSVGGGHKQRHLSLAVNAGRCCEFVQ